MKARLIFQTGASMGRTVDLGERPLSFGRDRTCDVVLDDPGVSGKHAEVVPDDDGWAIMDLGSTNGTLVNGNEIQSHRLRENDLVELGDLQLKFIEVIELPEHRAPAVAAPPPAAASPRVSPPAPPAAAPARAAAAAPPPPPPRPIFQPPPREQASPEDVALVTAMKRHTETIRKEIAKVIVGQREVLDQMLMCMMAGGHGLLVGLPGLAKTTMVRAVSEVLNLEFRRIQFTPDLMPSDITGTEILETNRTTQEKEFKFMRGPVFTNILLADEINRTPPKTQAALLEAMQEKHVTVGNETYPLDAPFFVLATQNPIEQEGTYPLPEAQMDRFMFNIWVDYPQEDEEEIIVTTTTVTSTTKPLKILDRAQVLQLQQAVRKIPVSPHVVKYATRLVRTSRPADPRATDFVKKYVHIGAGPRAGQYLILAAKARAVLEGRIHVSCNDVRRAAIPVLRHRIYTNFNADSEGLTTNHLVEKLLAAVEEPSENDYAPAAR